MKNKKGKKLVVLGAMAALLTLIGVSGSQTYAKYIESTEVQTNVATVAKWGMVITANTSDLFAEDYEFSAPESAVKSNGGTLIVSASASNAIVAPGCTGSMRFGVHGSAEVASKLAFSMPSFKQISLDKGAAGVYRPIQWTLEVNDNGITGNWDVVGTLENVDDFTAIENYLTNTLFEFAPNTPVNHEYRLSYSWPFEGTWVGEDTQNYDRDVLDTELGKQATLQQVSFKLAFTIEQIQEFTPAP